MSSPSYPHSNLKKAVHVLLVLAMVFSMTSIAYAADDVPPQVLPDSLEFNKPYVQPVVVDIALGSGATAATGLTVTYGGTVLIPDQDYEINDAGSLLTINLSFLVQFGIGADIPLTIHFNDLGSTTDTLLIQVVAVDQEYAEGLRTWDDSLGEWIPLDSDADGVPDYEDNAPLNSNPDQMDTDGDGIGDVIDPDWPPVLWQPAAYVFDLAYLEDLWIEYFPGGGTEAATAVESITINGSSLVLGNDFTNGEIGLVFLTSSYLSNLAVGTYPGSLTFDNAMHTTASFQLTITDSNNQSPQLDQTHLFFTDEPADVTAQVNLGQGDLAASDITSISEGQTLLQPDIDYWFDGYLLRISQTYLDDRAVGTTVVLDVLFNDDLSTHGTLQITIARSRGAINDSLDNLSTRAVLASYGIGQSFMPTEAGRLGEIKVKLAPGTPEISFGVRLYLYTWNPATNQPFEYLAASLPVFLSAANTTNNWTSFVFNDFIELDNWSSYAFMIDNVTFASPDSDMAYSIACNAQDTYPDGILISGEHMGLDQFAWTADPNADLQFAVTLLSDQDSDGDGVVDQYDNAPYVPNPGQEDTDGDGIGDVIDPDWPPYLYTDNFAYDKIETSDYTLDYYTGQGTEIAEGIFAVYTRIPDSLNYALVDPVNYLNLPESNCLILNAAFFDALPIGETELLVIFNNTPKTERTVQINITDTGNVAPSLNEYRMFNTSSPADLMIPVNLGLGDLAATDIDVIYFLGTPLNRGYDYDFSGGILTLYSDYLAAFGLATITLDVVFNDGSGTYGRIMVEIGTWNGPRNVSPEALNYFVVSDYQFPDVFAGQSFIPQATGYLNTIGVKVANPIAYMPLQVRIQLWSADWVTNVPEEMLAASSWVQIDSSTTIDDWTWFTFTSSITLYENQKYALLIDNLYGLGVNFNYDLGVSYNEADTYPDGCLIAGYELNSYYPFFDPYPDMDLQFIVNLTGDGDPEPDLDEDGIPDSSDSDVDGDGIANEVEGTADIDSDGEPNFRDTDSDGDGLPDNEDPTPYGDDPENWDWDDDGVPNEIDNAPYHYNPGQEDTDEDGIPDVIDPTPNGEPTVVDTDGDLVPDDIDNARYVANPDQSDLDHDGIGDVVDYDADNDGVPNNIDNAPWMANPSQSDIDHDGIGDVADFDADNDTVPNDDDNAPYIANPDQSDLDGDGIGDVADFDLDNDTVPNIVDNAPYVHNPDQSDIDRDGIGDIVDFDDDNDGVPDGVDNAHYFPNPDQSDIDGDGYGDVIDPDIDGDGIYNFLDNADYTPNPDQSDFDSDGIGDVEDLDMDSDLFANSRDNAPRVYNPDQADLDQDGIGDVADSDIDGDGIPNSSDNAPLAANPDQSDLDDDGIGDVADDDLDGDGIPNEADNALMVANPGQEDADHDGKGDVIDNDIVNVLSPSGALISGTTITATVAKTLKSVTINVTVSPNAVWATYADASCTLPLANNVLKLLTNPITAYIKVVSIEGVSQLYTLTVTKGVTTTSPPPSSKPGKK